MDHSSKDAVNRQCGSTPQCDIPLRLGRQVGHVGQAGHGGQAGHVGQAGGACGAAGACGAKAGQEWGKCLGGANAGQMR